MQAEMNLTVADFLNWTQKIRYATEIDTEREERFDTN